MKKALVMTFVLVLGLGFAAFADGTLSGVWDTDISLYPAASVFGDFIKSFTTEVDVDYTIGGFTFGMESTFAVAGMTGMDFNVDGVLGAFTLKADIDFAPRILATSKTVYTTIQTASSCLEDYETFGWDKKTVTKTYTAGFDDLTLESSVSIAGVSLDAIFYLDGEDNAGNYTVVGNYGTVQTASTGQALTGMAFTQTGSATIANSSYYGSGWRFEASGSFAGATLTGRVYFNLKDYFGSYAGYLGYYSLDYALADYFTESGVWRVVCNDCTSRFSSAEVVIEDVSFACTTFSGMLSFDCCGFSSVKLLVEDIGLGCCWDVNFDLMITFTDTNKTLKLDPEITLANACFTIDAAIVTTPAAPTTTQFELSGIDIRAITMEYTWNGITFTSATSWDLTNHPILGPAYLGGATSGPTKIYVLQPDTDFTVATFTYTETTESCALDAATYKPAVDPNGLGYWEFTSFACEKAYAWEKFSIDVDGDSCCGGAFDISAAFYFGDIKDLTNLDGSYYYLASATATSLSELVIFGNGYDAEIVGEADNGGYTSAWYFGYYGWTTGCNCCPCDDCDYLVDTVLWDADYTAETSNTSRLFDWIESDVDVVFSVGSGFDLTFGFDVTCWGWEDFTFGFEFTF